MACVMKDNTILHRSSEKNTCLFTGIGQRCFDALDRLSLKEKDMVVVESLWNLFQEIVKIIHDRNEARLIVLRIIGLKSYVTFFKGHFIPSER
ncbi:MAG: hypothetical protein NT096_01590 [Proteobacteria bacterium]|nr:hypothetical protein [Pseudomonadota bacterium]